MKKHIIGILIVMLLVVTSISAQESNIGTKQLDSCIDLIQSCSNCTYVNFTSFTYPNGTRNVIEVPGIKNGITYTYNNCSLTGQLGEWIIDGHGDVDGTDTVFVYTYEVTPSGKIASTGEAILYSLFCVILFLIISTIAFLIFTIPSGNERDERGFETKIFKIKYLRFIFIFLLWPLTILLLNFLNGLAVNFSALSLFSGTLGFLFEIMMRLSWPFTIIMIIWIVVMLIHDTNLQRQLDKFNKFDVFKGEL